MSEIDPTVPHSARVWNYWLGGSDNHPADRMVGDQIKTMLPSIVDVARHSRAFLGRAVRYLAGEAGIRQFLNVGSGRPTRTTPTRSPRASTAPAGSSTSTMTLWCWRTPRRC